MTDDNRKLNLNCGQSVIDMWR